MITLQEESNIRNAVQAVLDVHGEPKPDDPDWMGELRLFIDDECDDGVRDELVEGALDLIQKTTMRPVFGRVGRPTMENGRLGRTLA